MGDILFEEPVSFAAYSEFVESERHNNEPYTDDLNAQRAALLQGEQMEFLFQHGPGGVLLLPGAFEGHRITDAYPELSNDMADEASDMLWFDFDVAAQNGLDIGGICLRALKTHTHTRVREIADFVSLQQAVLDNAEKIKVINKLGLANPQMPEEVKYTPITRNPYYVFDRIHNRLIRALTQPEPNYETPTATDLEPEIELPKALGDHINALAYVCKIKLGRDIDEVARYNVYKLRHRKKFGKQPGNLFN